uniref:NUC153 domain-containing protein n=1 Tax=Panagrellus redivivus TaxID=6233 RepID=A0A7E4V476_PANRE
MSVQLLHKSLDYVNETDGLGEKKSKKRHGKSAVAEERDLLRNLDDRFQYDVESGVLVKKKRDQLHKREGDLSGLFSDRDAKNGYSLVDQYRDTKPPDVAAHNRRYLHYAEKFKVKSDVVHQITKPIRKAKKQKEANLNSRFDLKGTLIDKKKGAKPEPTSVFDDSDFDAIASLQHSKIQEKIKRVK